MDSEIIDKIKTEVKIKNIIAAQRIRKEFNSLRPNPFKFRRIAINVALACSLLYSAFLFKAESELFPMCSIVIIALVGLQSSLLRENRKTHKRIDLLLKIIENQETNPDDDSMYLRTTKIT